MFLIWIAPTDREMVVKSAPRKKKFNKNKSKSKLVAKSFKALGIFDKINFTKKYFLVNSVFILVR